MRGGQSTWETELRTSLKKKEKKGKKKSMLVKDMGFRIIGTEKGNSDLSRTDMGFGGEGD